MSVAIISRRARRDLTAARQWIKQDNPSAARALREAVIRAAKQIGEHPEIGKHRPELIGGPYRFFTLAGFPYIVVYNATAKPPLILRILHGARDLPDVLRDL